MYDEISHSKNFQAEKYYGDGSDIKEFAEKTDIKKSDGNRLIGKAKALKSLLLLTISV